MEDVGENRVNVGSKREGVLGGHWSRVRVSGAERQSGSPADDDLVGLQRAGYSFPESDEVDVLLAPVEPREERCTQRGVSDVEAERAGRAPLSPDGRGAIGRNPCGW